MSAITVESDLVHYEVLGRGRPVIFVHGWLGSWRYWVPTMQQLSVKYRTYALDLWGFGDSGKDATHYAFKDQVQLLHDFMEKLGITKAALVGHSFGAAVCLRFASQYPDRAPRVALISPPLFDLGGLDDAPVTVNAPKPAASTPAATPATSPTPPASTGSTPAPAGPAATQTLTAVPSNSAPSGISAASTAPATNTQAPATTNPTTPPPAPATPGAAASGAPGTSAPATPAATAAPEQQIEKDTIPRNPFRGLGDTPEEILARLQAKNTASSAGVGAPATPAKPTTPALPTSIGTPILPKSSPTPAAAPVAPASGPTPVPARTDAPNPLLKILTGKPADLLNRFVDTHAPDLDKLRAEVEKTDEAAITKSAQSFNGVNLAVELQRLPSPTLLLHGKDDPMFPAPAEELIHQINKGKPAGHLLALIEPDLRHFPMLEINAKFNRLLMDFLEAQDLNNVQFKDQWRRTMR